MQQTLESGLDVVSEPIQGLETVAISLTFHAGFRDDPAGSGAGLTHIVEHAIFEASQATVGHGVQYEAARLGVMLGAKTYADTVQLTAVCEPHKLAAALNLLPTSPLYVSRKQFAQALTLVQTEVAESLARHQGERELWVQASSGLYPDWRYGHDGFGYDVKESLDLYEAFKDHLATNFVPSNSTLVVVGGFDDKSLTAALLDLPNGNQHGDDQTPPRRDSHYPSSKGVVVIRRSPAVVAVCIDIGDTFTTLTDYTTLLVAVELLKENEQVLGVSLGMFGPFCSRAPEMLTITLRDPGTEAQSLSVLQGVFAASLADISEAQFQRAKSAASEILAKETRSNVVKSELIANLQVLFGGGSLALLSDLVLMPRLSTKSEVTSVAQRLLSPCDMAGV